MGKHTPAEILAYIDRMKKNSLRLMKAGKAPSVIFIYREDCKHCHDQVELFWRKGTTKNNFHDGLDVPAESLIATEAQLKRAVAAGKMSKHGYENKLEIIDKIIPVNKLSKLGLGFVKESKEWSKKTGKPNDFLNYTPTFIDFKTHEVILIGHQNGRVLHNMTKETESEKRRDSFSKIYSAFIGKTCDGVSCEMGSRVKEIDEDTYEKEAV